MYTDFSLRADRSERRRVCDTSVVLRCPIRAYACFSTDVDGHYFDVVTSPKADVSRRSTVREFVIVRAHDRISRVGDSDDSGDVRRSLLGRVVDFRNPPHVELNTERANIHIRMNSRLLQS